MPEIHPPPVQLGIAAYHGNRLAATASDAYTCATVFTPHCLPACLLQLLSVREAVQLVSTEATQEAALEAMLEKVRRLGAGARGRPEAQVPACKDGPATWEPPLWRSAKGEDCRYTDSMASAMGLRCICVCALCRCLRSGSTWS